MIKIINKKKKIISIICLNFHQHLSADIIVRPAWSSLSLSPIHNWVLLYQTIIFISRSMFCNYYTFFRLPICSPEELIIIDNVLITFGQMVRSPICVWGVGWSDPVTKWHLMREDDDHEFEIVITRSHSLLCFLTASIQKMDYQSKFQCKLNTDYVWFVWCMLELCPSNVTILAPAAPSM